MESRLCVPEESSGNAGLLVRDRDSDSAVFQVELRAYRPSDINEASGILWQFWNEVNQEDLSDWVEIPVDGKMIPMTRIEAQVCRYIAQGCKIQLAVQDNGSVCGVLVGNIIFEKILAVKALYVDKKARGRGLASQLILSLGEFDKLLFQTRKKNPPDEMFGHINEPKQILEDNDLITWELEGYKDGNVNQPTTRAGSER